MEGSAGHREIKKRRLALIARVSSFLFLFTLVPLLYHYLLITSGSPGFQDSRCPPRRHTEPT